MATKLIASRRAGKLSSRAGRNGHVRTPAYYSIVETTPLTGAEGNSGAFQASERPAGLTPAIKKARYWYRYAQIVRAIINTQRDFFNFGFEVKAVNKAEAGKLKGWLAEKSDLESAGQLPRQTRQAAIEKFVREAWLDLLVTSNIVALWRETSNRPMVYRAEDITFTDRFGEEKLTINHGLTSEEIRKGKFTTVEKAELLKSPQLTLTHDNEVFFFSVLKDERVGEGLSRPALEPVFQACAQFESHETGDSLLAASCRTVYEQHKMGHEIKAGPHAGMPTHFWKKNRADAFLRERKGKTGCWTWTGNFDHQVVPAANWPDPKHFDVKKYESIIARFMLWGMPLTQMILGKSLNPNLMEVLRVQALAQRAFIEPFLNQVIGDAYDAPVPLRLFWSGGCFRDSRIAADLIKTAFAGGPLSQESLLELIGFAADAEREKKAAEAKLPEGETTPIFDAAHGPAKVSAGKAGRPAGMPDGGAAA